MSRRQPRVSLGALLVLAVIGAYFAAKGCAREPRRTASPTPDDYVLAIPREFVDGIALAIVYDTSGSMEKPARAGGAQGEPKYRIANRALRDVVGRVETYLNGATPEQPRRVDCALVRFDGKSARLEIPLAPFDAPRLREFARTFDSPAGSTPLGRAFELAARSVLESPLLEKHVLVISDGENTDGATPEAALAGMLRSAQRGGVALHAHFVAFDVDAKVFAGVKQLGAGLFSAADAQQLEAQLKTILEREILLEREDGGPAQPTVPTTPDDAKR